MNRVCTALGDCGAYINIAGAYTDFGIGWRQNGKQKTAQIGFLESVQESAEKNEKVFNK